MAINVVEHHSVTVPWAANGNIYLQLGPKPYTITRMVFLVTLDVSTGTTPGTFSDPWDRVIASLNLSSAGYTYLDAQDMRLLRHLGRFEGYQLRTPAGLGASVSNATVTFGYSVHFGVSPVQVNLANGRLVDNPWDLTGGIPARDQSLVLGGQWGAANAPGSGYTINSGTMNIVLYGVLPREGDSPENYMPRAKVKLFTHTVTETSASSVFSNTYNVPPGDYLHSALIMTTTGANADRTFNVFNSFQADVVPLNVWFMRFLNDDVYGIASQLTQFGEDGWPVADDPASPGTLNIGKVADDGLYYLNFVSIGRQAHPLYGFDMRQAAIGDLIFRYGVATPGTIRILYRKYVM